MYYFGEKKWDINVIVLTFNVNYPLSDSNPTLNRLTLSLSIVLRVQMKSWAGKALETVNCCAFLKRRLIGPC
jgi:hypothetical protein